MNFEFLNSIKRELISVDFYEDLEDYSCVEENKDNALLNFYTRSEFLREEKSEEIINIFMPAYEKDPVSAMKVLFYIRDKEEGLGERKVFRVVLNQLGKINSSYLKANINLVPIFGRWDDLYSLFDTALQGDAIRLIRKQIGLDLKSKKPSTLAKWLKSENASSKETKTLGRKTRLALDLNSKEYRVLLSNLRKRVNIVESSISEGKWKLIKYENVSSGAMHKYHKAFLKHDRHRYTDYLNVLNSKKIEKIEPGLDINPKSYFPYDLLEGILMDTAGLNESYFCGLWESMPNYTKSIGEDTLVCLGLSHKSSKRNHKIPAYYGGIGTILYLLNKNSGDYKDHILTMNTKPNLIKIQGNTLLEKIKEIEENSFTKEVNLEIALDLILFAAIKNNINKNKMPKRLLFILDDRCKLTYLNYKNQAKKTSFLSENQYEKFKNKWVLSGYEMPEICFWRIDRYRDNSKIIVDNNNFKYASGYSHEVFKAIINGEEISSEVLVEEILLSLRYNLIREEM